MSSKSVNEKKRKSGDDSDCENDKREKKPKHDDPPLVKHGKSHHDEHTESSGTGFFSGVHAYILVTGIGKSRANLFTAQLERNGGTVHSSYVPSETTHIVIDEKMEADRLCRLLKLDQVPKAKIVQSLWLSSCLKAKSLIAADEFELSVAKCIASVTKSIDNSGDSSKSDDAIASTSASANEPGGSVEEQSKTDSNVSETEKQHKLPKVGMMFSSYKPKKAAVTEGDGDSDVDSDYVPSGDEEEEGQAAVAEALEQMPTPKRFLPKGNWVCAQSSSNKQVNVNKHITDKLEALARTYENTNDRWRALGYQKAIMMLRKHPTPITTWEEAKSLPGVGAKLADKIWEIVESGALRKLDELNSSEEMQAINLFTNVWGAGAHTARTWVQQGLRTLEDLHTKANLTRNQKIGLKHYDEFLDRMSHEEAGKIEAVVKAAIEKLDPGLLAMACGSYRRGKVTCGDVDVLVTHPDGKSHRGIFQKILSALHESGFLTDDLVQQEDNGCQKKYLGVCKLPGENTKHRRLDIIVVPYDEYACAVMYFTGSAHFNRSMRNLAGKMNMSLSEHALCTGVIRKGGEKLNKGTPLPTPTEESVFQYLGLKYRPPEERDH